MTTVRCKFKCDAVTKSDNWDKQKSPFLFQAKFSVVLGGNKENEAFFGSTPGGTLEVIAVKDDVFTPGKEYYLDISEAG